MDLCIKSFTTVMPSETDDGPTQEESSADLLTALITRVEDGALENVVIEGVTRVFCYESESKRKV